MLITLSGLSGCGKSSAAKIASEKLGIPTIDIGKFFRELAEKHGMDVVAFGKYAVEHPEIDQELDEKMLNEAKKMPDALLQGRLSGWMSKLQEVPALRIWLDAAPEVRAGRIAGRENMTSQEALAEITARDADNQARYKKLYGLDLNDRSIYDVVIRTDTLNLQEVSDALVKAIMIYGRRNSEQPNKGRGSSN